MDDKWKKQIEEDNESIFKENDKIEEMLDELNADGYREGPEWQGYSVLIPEYEKEVIIGVPTVILIKGNEVRFSNYDESFKYLKYEQGAE